MATHWRLLYRILRNNSFTGFIPDEIAKLKELEILDLGSNNFSQPLPSELCNNPSLEIMWVQTEVVSFSNFTSLFPYLQSYTNAAYQTKMSCLAAYFLEAINLKWSQMSKKITTKLRDPNLCHFPMGEWY